MAHKTPRLVIKAGTVSKAQLAKPASSVKPVSPHISETQAYEQLLEEIENEPEMKKLYEAIEDSKKITAEDLSITINAR